MSNIHFFTSWLPVIVRDTYKIAYLCYLCHSSTTPLYFTDMLRKSQHSHNTSSSSHTMPLLNGPAHSKTILNDHSFSFTLSLFQMMPDVLHYCHHLTLIWKYNCFIQFAKTEIFKLIANTCACLDYVIDVLSAIFPKQKMH